MAARNCRPDNLTPKRLQFVEEYFLDLNAAGAYKRAGYKVKNDHLAAVEGARLLTNPDIQAAIQERIAARAERTQIKADNGVRELALVAFSDMRQFATWGPSGVSLIDSNDLPPDAGPCVAEVSQTSTGTGCSLRFKLHDKIRALHLLGLHLGLFGGPGTGKHCEHRGDRVRQRTRAGSTGCRRRSRRYPEAPRHWRHSARSRGTPD
jgi:phage terminase small subunit